MAVSLAGLLHIGASVGIDDVDIMNLDMPGIAINHGSNKVDLNVNMEFPSKSSIRDKVASFGRDLSEHFGETNQVFTASNIKVGLSDTDYLKFLSKAHFGIKSSAILNQKVVDSLLSGEVGNASFLDLGQLKKADIEFHDSSDIDASILANISIPFQVLINMPFFKAGTHIDQISFM
jgi:hypothetical protein